MADTRKDEHDMPAEPGHVAAQPKVRLTGAMHEDVPVWSDPCCSCEAEPYWLEPAEQQGTDTNADDEALPE